jgi:hypothetical protein
MEEESGATAECAARPRVGSLALHATWEKLGESRESDGLRRKGGGKRGIPSSDTDEGNDTWSSRRTFCGKKQKHQSRPTGISAETEGGGQLFGLGRKMGKQKKVPGGVWQYLRNFGQVPGRKWPSVGHFSPHGSRARHGGVPLHQERPGVHKMIRGTGVGEQTPVSAGKHARQMCDKLDGPSNEAAKGGETNRSGSPSKSEARRSFVGMIEAPWWLIHHIFCRGWPSVAFASCRAGIEYFGAWPFSSDWQIAPLLPLTANRRGAPLRGSS